MQKYRRKTDIVLRPIHGTWFLINIADNYKNDTCALHEVNETGAFLWKHLESPGTVNGLAHELSEAIIDDVDESIILQDVSDYLSSLLELGFLEVCDHD